MKNYSYKDSAWALIDALNGSFSGSGQKGLSTITISMATERTVTDVSADGTVQVSYVSGDNGVTSIEMQQTSDAYNFFVNCYNAAKAAADSGNSIYWAARTMTIRDLTSGLTHVLRGISFAKLPDYPRAAQGQKVTWTLPCAEVITMPGSSNIAQLLTSLI